MINCYNCYQCKHIGNILYCPFFGLNPCYRGEHELVLPKITKPSETTLIIPLSESRGYQYRKLIFYQLKNKKSITDIANYLKINVYTLRQYVDKVLEYNNITLKELKHYVVLGE